MGDHLAVANDRTQTLNTFLLSDLAVYTPERTFPAGVNPEFRVFYVGRDDVHGILKHLLARCSRSLKMNMFGYDDDELDAIIRVKLEDAGVFVQGTLDSSQAGGVHEKALLAGWDEAMRDSFAVGRSASGQISHTKGGVLDSTVAWEGSTNWSASGEGTIIDPAGTNKGRKSQNNTLVVYTNHVEVGRFATELDVEHVVALHQQAAKAAKEAATHG